MNDPMALGDPAAGQSVDRSALRSKVDEKIRADGPEVHVVLRRRPWMVVLAGFAVLMVAMTLPVLLRPPTDATLIDPGFATDLPGVDLTIPLASGGVQTGAVDGDTIWIVTALAGQLQEISARTGEIVASYPIDGHVEGVLLGADHLWLLSYNNGGQVLRFDPEAGQVDMTISIGAAPWRAAWYADSLWVSTDGSQLLQISPEGEILSTQPGELRGTGLGYLWVNDPATGLINSLSADGTQGTVVIPTDGAITPTGADVREITEAAGYLWLGFSDPGTTGIARFDLETGILQPMSTAREAWSATEFDGFVWMTSRFDNVLIRIEPTNGDVTIFPLPGKPGGLHVADEALWVVLYQPGSLLRLDVEADLIEPQPIIAGGGSNDHRLYCTAPPSYAGGRPTVVLEPEGWTNYGSWSVVQALISRQGYRVCATGYLGDETVEPIQRAEDLAVDLDAGGIAGPYLLVAAGDGVHTMRLFAEGRTDVAGVVLVDPIPLGFGPFYDDLLGDPGHPPWLDIPPSLSESLIGFGSVPLVIIGQDPKAAYLNERFVEFAGETDAEALNARWQEGLAFYEDLSSNSRQIVARGSAMTAIVWSQPGIVVRQVLDVLDQIGSQ